MATKQELSEKSSGAATPPAAQDVPGFPLMDLWARMDRAVHDFADVWQMPTLSRGLWDMAPYWTPLWSRGDVNVRFDVAETEDAVELSAELPGIEEKDVDLTVCDGMLTIKGEKRVEEETKEKDYYFSERRYGSFVRTLPLPQAVDVGKIKATFANGVLKVNLPKLPEAKTKSKTHKIAIGH
ncbi:MAG TPA: Hsp20/alpha crystallin family protein [Nitrospiraceae bacterium]|jgi:HSP20 family protein